MSMSIFFTRTRHRQQRYESWKGNKGYLSVVPTMRRPYHNAGRGGKPPISSEMPENAITGDKSTDPYIRRARPLKHWRKQLTVVSNIRSRLGYVGAYDTPNYITTTEFNTTCADIDTSGAYSNIAYGNIHSNYGLNTGNTFNTSLGGCCNPEQRWKKVKSGHVKVDEAYSMSTAQYLQKRCKTFNANRVSNFDLSSNVHYVKDLSLNITRDDLYKFQTYCECPGPPDSCSTKGCKTAYYKPRNAQYFTNGAVSVVPE